MEVATFVLVTIATVASVAAAFYARRGDLFNRSSLQPHITVMWQGMPAGNRIIIGNGGGQAPRLWWVGHDGLAILAGRGVVPAQSQGVNVTVHLVGDVAYPVDTPPSTTVCLAEDMRGGLWDCVARKRINGKVEAHVRTQLEKVGLTPDAVRRLIDALLVP